jgi:maleate cis-trans isomerase
MIGWRGHLGKISPAPIAGRFVREFYDVVPEGVDITCAPLTVQKISRDSMEQMLALVGSATELLAEKGVDAIYLGGVPPIVMRDPGYDLELVGEMERRGGRPASTDVTGVMDAFRALAIRRLVMAAPFEDWVIELIRKYYGAAGFDIVHMKGMPLVTSTQRRALPLDIEYTFTRQVFEECKEPVDGIYIPCGGWGTVRNVERLEQDLGKPVVTWFTAMIWWFLTKRRIRAPIRGFGSLLERL